MKKEQQISIPNSILAKLFDNTGSETSGGRGFVLFYINDEGSPSIASKCESGTVALALRKAMEIYIEETHPEADQ